ncbi:hypothetical protein CEUSTIGMA_g11930.t1 [Chlamydomonas eustigma]|uniref:Uncharacterized protein n=1 Tax=Chlamydomonas eustigma TaxID=1157962 RepID=A0A250XNY7_9CHLO|nr:hypothetical protein CEUSTIGMA_g11930.t1 [Chlamydomonas eustigma]|eukprot:GAX84510.1 hypothetical protein CEUSTIGMA_g11930.t1 [Chlamydomonas eustigma]
MLLAHVFVITSPEGCGRSKARAAIRDRTACLLERSNVVRNVEHVSADFEPSFVSGSDLGALVDLEPSNTREDVGMRGQVRTMHLREVSNALKHLAALRRIAASDSSGFSMVLEDDSVFARPDEDVGRSISAVIEATSKCTDLVFLSLFSRNGSTSFDDAGFCDAEDPGLPACDAYLVTRSGAARLAEQYLPVRFPAALQLTYLLRCAKTDHGTSYASIAVPNVFFDGSKAGLVTSSLTANNLLVWNQAYCRMRVLLSEGDDARLRAESEALLESIGYKEHPDVLVLIGDVQSTLGDLALARASYAAALEAYERDDCVVNTSSAFMRNYIAAYRPQCFFHRRMYFNILSIVSFLRSIVNFLRSIVNFLRSIVSFLRSIVSFLRSIVNFLRSIVNFLRSIVSFLRSIVSFLRSIVSFLRSSIVVNIDVSVLRRDQAASSDRRGGKTAHRRGCCDDCVQTLLRQSHAGSHDVDVAHDGAEGCVEPTALEVQPDEDHGEQSEYQKLDDALDIDGGLHVY